MEIYTTRTDIKCVQLLHLLTRGYCQWYVTIIPQFRGTHTIMTFRNKKFFTLDRNPLRNTFPTASSVKCLINLILNIPVLSLGIQCTNLQFLEGNQSRPTLFSFLYLKTAGISSLKIKRRKQGWSWLISFKDLKIFYKISNNFLFL
jgi:hypothetical protein